MSYILDALRRADAERDRGAVPTLHARHEAGPMEDDERTPRPWLALAGGAVVLVVAGAIGAWWLMGGDPEPRVSVVAAGPSPVTGSQPPPAMPTAPTAGGLPSALPAPPSVAPQPPPTTQAAAPVAAMAAPAAPGPTPLAAPRPARAPLTAASATAAPPARRATAASAPASGAAPDDRNRVYAVADLPDAVKRDLPRVAISGGSWSRDKASRMVMVNGQVLHEGDAVAPGLVLESIRLKSAVLAWKGYRYEVSY
jgi:general secretion pathway protein B